MEVNEEPSQFVTGDGNQQETMISSDTRDLNLPKANVQKDEVIENSKTETTDTSGGKEFTPPANEKPMRICLIGELGNDDELLNISKLFNVPVEVSETGDELLADTSWLTYFVLKNFDGTIFDKLVQQKQKILGPGALRHAATKGDGVLPKISRPRYNYAMAGCVTSFSGIKQRDILTHLIHLVHSMGGSVRKDMGTNVTHLICNSGSGKKYAYAVTFRLSVVHPSWVYNAWENRDIVEFNAMVEPVIGPHKVKVFDGLKVCFFGFPPEESEHMVDVLKQYGGIAADIGDPDCSHVVVDEQAVHSRLDMKDSRTHIVGADWFWYSIQNGYADEEEFKFADYLDSIATTPCKDRRDSFPMSLHKRKRKRLSQKSTADAVTLSAGKRRSSVSDAGLLSVSGGFLDCTASPDRHDTPGKLNAVTEEPSVAEPTPKAKSMRFNHFMDLFTTETNYVNILDTIVNLFKEPLEKMADSPDELLNKSEIRGIFNNFIPIYDVHKRMLNSLKTIHQNWSDDALIGQIIIDNRDELIKAYPPYVNFFEQMKEMLIQCDQQKPRFHAFLKINQAKPECGRQTLQDLMIRPVQRLPSVTLILNDIIKYTSKSNPDLQKLEESLKAIREVMTYINEDKRKTEGQLAMFDIFNDIDNCPPQLVSSHRSFVSKCEVTELSHSLAKRGDTLVLFLFNDTIEVCKKRSRRGFNNAQTPPTSTTSINTLNSTNMQQKSYKHIKLMPLSSVQEVVDITDSPQAFAINCKSQQENKDKIFAFSICDEVDKTVYLKNLCKQMAENACRADGDKFMVYLESQDLAIDINSVNLGTLSSMFKFASRTRWKVGRALSFSKAPGKIKRAVSTVMTSPYDNLMTPTTQLEQMKLASCTNISEMGKGEDDADGLNHVQLRDGVMGIQRPMSVQPTRRNKTNTMPNSLRRI